MVIAVPPPPPALVANAAPAPIGIADLVQMTTLSSLAVSPDGKWVAFRADRNSLVENRMELSWYVAPASGRGPAQRIGNGGLALYDDSGTVLSEAPIWSPASNAIYFRALIDGEIQVWRAGLDGKGAVKLTSDPADVRTLKLEADGRSLSYTVDATRAALEQAERDAFDEGTPGDGSADLVDPASRGSYVDGRLISRRSIRDWFEYGHLLWRTPARSIDIALPDADRSVGQMPVARFAPANLTPRWEPLAKHWRLVVAPQSAALVTCTAKPCDDYRPVAAIQLPGKQDYLVTLRDVALNDSLVSWDPRDQSTRVVMQATGLLTGGGANECAGIGTYLACVAESAANPPRLVRIPLAGGRMETLFAPNEDLARRVTVSIRPLEWRDQAGYQHSGQLILPSTPKPAGGYPMVFTYYVCDGFMRGGTGDELPLIPLAEKGVATLCINRAKTDLTHQDWPADQQQAQEDIEHATGKLVEDGVVDRKRIGEWGYSFGSEVMSQILIHTDLLAAAASASNLLDPGAYWFNSLPGRSYPNIMQSAFHLGAPDSDVEGWREVTPGMNLDRVRAPLLIQAPEREARSMIETWSKFSRISVPTELWEFADEWHTKIFPRHIAVSMDRNMDWFRYWLDGARDPEPAKRAQYDRWDALARRWHSAAASDDRASP